MDIQPTVRRRRTHTESFKQAVINACQAPGASVAGVALDPWLSTPIKCGAGCGNGESSCCHPGSPLPVVDAAPAFVPVTLPPARSETGPIVIEVRRGTTVIHVAWPLQAAGDCAVWLRDWLR
jgi:transposase